MCLSVFLSQCRGEEETDNVTGSVREGVADINGDVKGQSLIETKSLNDTHTFQLNVTTNFEIQFKLSAEEIENITNSKHIFQVNL